MRWVMQQQQEEMKKKANQDQFNQANKAANQLIGQAISLSNDIEDFIEENPSDELGNFVEDLDRIISRMEEMRSSFRAKHNELKILYEGSPGKYTAQLEKACTTTLEEVKKYLKVVRSKRKSLRDSEDTEKTAKLEAKEKKLEFLGTEAKRTISSLNSIFKTDLSNKSDEDITKIKNELSDHEKTLQTIPKMIREIIDCGQSEGEISDIKTKYGEVLHNKVGYLSRLESELSSREIEKQKTFKTSSLNIKLPKFKGYNSSLDIYTFQDEFEKVHLKSTPKSLLPDLLKNNLLEGSALALVKDVNDIDDIWKRLKEAYGDTKMMLAKKLSELNNIENFGKIKDSSKAIDTVSKLINLMKDLLQLSKRHKIQNHLFYGDGLEKIYRLMGDGRINRWLSQKSEDLEGEALWLELIQFLEKELKICQQKALIFAKSQDSKPKDPKDPPKPPRVAGGHHSGGDSGPGSKTPQNPSSRDITVCFICGETDHVQTTGPGGMKLVQYFVCKKWAEMTNADRVKTLRSKGLCFQCLFPGAESNKGKHATGRCQRDFVCKHADHDQFPTKKHVLVCEDHKDTPENQEILDKFKKRCILKQHQNDLPSHAKEIGFVHYVTSPTKGLTNMDSIPIQPDIEPSSESVGDALGTSDASTSQQASYVERSVAATQFVDSVQQNAVYMLQTVLVDNEEYNLFYDSGCGDFVSRWAAVQRIRSRAVQLLKGPLTLGGLGDIIVKAAHGIYGITLPLADGGEVSLAGRCMDKITETFPSYPLQGKIEEDIRRAYLAEGGNLKKLPLLPASVGGGTDFMIGSKYLKYFPKEVYQLPSGLTICRSHFKNVDGSRGVICGPHEVINLIDEQYHTNTSTFLNNQRQLFRFGYQVNPDVSLLGFKDNDDSTDEEDEDVIPSVSHYHVPRLLKRFMEAEFAGSEITYRCPTCRKCTNCKCHEHVDAITLKDEVEQDLIEKSVHIDLEKCDTTADLPLLSDPTVKLAPNRHKALRTFHQQMKYLAKNPEDREAVVKSEKKLQDLGFVVWVKDLPVEVQEMLKNNPVQNFLPWNIVFKENSPTTPCRLVFNASQPTDTGYSLNDILPKGINMLNKLVEIFIKWRVQLHAFHCDVHKMYNAIKLSKAYWCLQRYLFSEGLDPNKIPEEKLIMTLIYGVRSSGNQAQCALRKIAELFKKEYPDVYEIIHKDTYMDDCMSGGHTKAEMSKKQDDLQLVLGLAGFSLKGFTESGEDPAESLSPDGVSIGTFGMKWFSKIDEISLDTPPLNFAKKRRGKKPKVVSEIPKDLKKLQCASKLGEIFDLTGICAPLIAGMKTDLHELNTRKLDWGDVLPNEFHQQWHSHFHMMTEIKNLRYQRAVVPQDAVDLNATTLEFGDASQALVCVAIYIRFKRTNGEFSCQLIFAKSRLVPDGMTQPRAELYAALVNAHSGEIVRRALGKYQQHSLKFTDSQIVLYWICKNDQVLKEWVRNRIIEIHRFTDILRWRYVRSHDMVADIGTRRCTSIDVVKHDSVWIQGFSWMRAEEKDFPMMTADEVTLSNQEFQNMKKEVQGDIIKLSYITSTGCDSERKTFNENLLKRYQLSEYIIDPNRHRYTEVVRILAIVFRFISRVKYWTKNKEAKSQRIYATSETFVLSEDDIKAAKVYMFKRASLEVKHFLKPSQYKDISQDVDGILTYTGRILPTDSVSIVGRATQVMKDLTSTTFCVPLVEKDSPLAYSIASDVHWNHPTANHCGIETVWRYVLKHAYIVEGRSVVTKIGKSCERCRYLNKKAFEMSMGPVSPHNLNIAPAFYVTQTDLAGPFSAHCHHHKRNTIKVWMVIFCCATTSTTSIKVMEDYSTTAFLQAFTRFSSEVGYPKTLLCDEGSQLVKGCESMTLTFRDLAFRLHEERGVDFDVCPVGGHNMNGRVERKIREIRNSLSKSLMNDRLSIMQWETLSASISNTINNMPLALGNSRSTTEALDLLTPNRLKMGRNNERSPEGCVTVEHPDRILEENQQIFDAWFELWLSAHVPKLIDQPKWFKSDENLKPGDVVLFLKEDSSFKSCYQYGMIAEVDAGRDHKVRKVKVRYRNHNEDTDRFTNRSVRGLVVIHRIDETNLMEELGEVSRMIEQQFQHSNLA